MLGIQKDELVRLLQYHFIRTVGRYTSVSHIQIADETWGQFAEKLNYLGPSKNAEEWMKVRMTFVLNTKM